MNLHLRSLGLGLGFLLCSSLPAFADVVKLKNGEKLEGVVVSNSNGYLVLKVANGEMGFASSLVESVDANAGPKAADLAKAEEASNGDVERYLAERRQQLAARNAARAVEASASRRDAEPAPAAPAPEANYETDVRARLAAINTALSGVSRSWERDKLRWALYRYYFGAGDYDAVLHVVR